MPRVPPLSSPKLIEDLLPALVHTKPSRPGAQAPALPLSGPLLSPLPTTSSLDALTSFTPQRSLPTPEQADALLAPGVYANSDH